MKKSEKRPMGITLLGWFYIITGGLVVFNLIFGFLWNAFLSQRTNVYWETATPIGTLVLLTSYIFLGIGILRFSKICYVITMILAVLFIWGGTLYFIESLEMKESVSIGVASGIILLSVLIGAYLIKQLRRFFPSRS